MPISLDLFNDYSKFQNFFNDEQEIQEIADQAKEEKEYEPHLYFNRWQVCWITIKYPFDALLECIFDMLAATFGFFGCTSCERVFEILSMHQMRDHKHLKAQEKFKEEFLAPSFNTHRIGTCGFYCSPTIERDKIDDSNVKACTFDPKDVIKDTPDSKKQKFLELTTHLPVYHENGICRGASQWFMNLYLKTQHLFKDPRNHFVAVCKQFEKGCSEKAALLQTFDEAKIAINLFGIKPLKPLIEYKISGDSSNPEDIKIAELVKKKFQTPKVLHQLKTMENGFYSVGIRSHRFNYIKVSDEIGFVWNPNGACGGISVSGKNQAENLSNLILKILDDHSPTDWIAFHRWDFASNVAEESA